MFRIVGGNWTFELSGNWCEVQRGAAGRTERAEMSAVGAKKGVLEVFKFGCYISIPILMMSAFAYDPQNLERIIRNVSSAIPSTFVFLKSEVLNFLLSSDSNSF